MALPADVRVALRSLRRRPAFTAMAVLMLALGIGANTAMFSVVDAVLLRSLPYGDPDSLVVVYADGSARGQGRHLATTPGDFLDWRNESHVFAGLTALHNESRRITSVEAPVVPLVHAVTANYFDVLGVEPLLGRGFRPGEDEPGRDDVVILSYGLWQSVFGGDPGVVGRRIALDGRQHTVVGVMGREFYSAHLFAVQPGLWVPMPLADSRQNRERRDLMVYGRLAAGTSLAAAQAAMTALGAEIAREYPDSDDGWGMSLVPLRTHVVGRFSRTGAILLAAVGLVLLIACANAANLSLARATERAQEVAMRAALGASRLRIARQLLTESLILSLTAGALGALLARFGAGPLARLIPAQAGVPFLDRVAVDGRVLAFTLVIAVVSGVLFGLAPSRHAAHLDLVEALREGGRGTSPARVRRLREALVVGEVALAVVVVSAAGLVLRTFAGLREIDPGFDAAHVLKLRTSLRGEHFRSAAARIAHFDELKRRLASLPGVASVSAVSFEPPPVGDGGAVFGAVRLAFPGEPDTSAAAATAIARPIMPDYFETMGIPMLEGRSITGADTPDGPRVAVISECMARRDFGGLDPLGRTFSVDGPGQMPMRVVGVVGDVITAGTDPSPAPAFYTPYTQSPLSVMSVVMRVPKGDPTGPAREAERMAWSLSPDTNVYAVETLDRQIDDLNWRTRFGAILLGAFAVLALLLGMLGIYAVVSYSVLQRRSEIALRMALGARARDVLAMVVAGGLRLVLFGLVVGLAASLAATRALSGFLYGVSPGDPATMAGVCLLLLVVATGACLGPALHASRLDPQAALRSGA
jgi:putative ABC transport system permease protein